MLLPRAIIAIFIALFLSACTPQVPLELTEGATAVKEKTSEVIDTVVTSTIDTATTVVASITEEDASEEAEADEIMEEVAPTNIEAAEDTPTQLDPAELSGLDALGLVARLGQADYQRQEGGAEILQYRLPTCVLDFVMSGEEDARKLTSWHSRHRIQGEAYDEVSCFENLAARDLR